MLSRYDSQERKSARTPNVRRHFVPDAQHPIPTSFASLLSFAFLGLVISASILAFAA